jgi:hypothetical protein
MPASGTAPAGNMWEMACAGLKPDFGARGASAFWFTCSFIAGAWLFEFFIFKLSFAFVQKKTAVHFPSQNSILTSNAQKERK